MKTNLERCANMLGSMIRYVVLLFLVACQTAPETQQDLDEVIAASFDQAAIQYRAMDQTLPDTLFPRTTNPDGSLETNTSEWWTSGFFPGNLGLLYEHTHEPFRKERTWHGRGRWSAKSAMPATTTSGSRFSTASARAYDSRKIAAMFLS